MRKTANGVLLLAASLTLVTVPITAAGGQAQADPQADNSGKNLPTEHRDAHRADGQSHNGGDVELTRKIRQSIVRDKSLSTYAHNVKVVTINGVVRLQGPVRSQEEKDSVGAKAADIAGAANVKNDLMINAVKK